MVIIIGNELPVGQSQPVRQYRQEGVKIGIAFNENRMILQDGNIPADEVHGRKRLVSPPSEVYRLGPHRDGKALQLLTAIGMLIGPYHAETVVLLEGRPANRAGRQGDRRRESALSNIVNDRASCGHFDDGRHQVNRAKGGSTGHDAEGG